MLCSTYMNVVWLHSMYLWKMLKCYYVKLKCFSLYMKDANIWHVISKFYYRQKTKNSKSGLHHITDQQMGATPETKYISSFTHLCSMILNYVKAPFSWGETHRIPILWYQASSKVNSVLAFWPWEDKEECVCLNPSGNLLFITSLIFLIYLSCKMVMYEERYLLIQIMTHWTITYFTQRIPQDKSQKV